MRTPKGRSLVARSLAGNRVTASTNDASRITHYNKYGDTYTVATNTVHRTTAAFQYMAPMSMAM
jgi:hypothetical protein